MRRRRALQSLVAIPAAGLLPAPAAAQSAAPAPAAPPRDEQYKIELTNAEAASDPTPRFFSPRQFTALQQLCAAVMPAASGRPGAVECEVPEFLDFLVSAAPADHQQLYRQGLDHLSEAGVNEQSLTPLRQPWTYHGPSDAMGKFLVTAKEEILHATFNSRVYAEAASQGRRRGAGATNYYWLPLE